MKVISQELIHQKEYPAVSIIMPTHPRYPDYKLDIEHMGKIIDQLEIQIKTQYSKKQTQTIITKLKDAVKRIDFSKLDQGLIVYVSPHTEKIIHLPFPVTSEKIVVDDSFEIRDLVQLMKSCRHCLLAVLSQNKVKTYLGLECKLSPIKYLDMPENLKDVYNEHSLPGWDYFDSKSWEEKNILNYIHFIDKVLENELHKEKLDVILLGDRKLLGLYKKHTHIENKIVGFIEGNYENSSISELKKLIQPVLIRENKKEEEYAMRLLAEAIDKDNFSAGITQVWRSASEGRGRLLIVEKDYRQGARIGADNFTIHIDLEEANPWNRIADAVDDIIQKVLINKGDVVFVENGMLEEYQKIVLINRY